MLLLQKKRRTAPRASRAQQTLPCILEKTESAEAGKTSDQDRGECRDLERLQEITEHPFQLEFDRETKESQNSSHRLLSRPLFNSCGPHRLYPRRENSLARIVTKLENGLCSWSTNLNEEAGVILEQIEKREGITRPNHSGCFEGIAVGMFGNAGEIAVRDVLGHEFPGGVVVLLDGSGTKSGGCCLIVQV